MTIDTTELEEQYLTRLVDSGDRHDIETVEPVRSQTGVKLVDSGTKINRELLDKLLRHKLQKPIDCSVVAKDAITVPEIVTRARRIAQDEPNVCGMLSNLRDHDAPLRAISRILLIPAVSVKLMVAADQAPDRIDHGVRVALYAAALGAHLGLDSFATESLATAGLFHDLGEMSLDPAIFNGASFLDAAERRQIEAHPLIMFLFLQRFPEYHPHVSRPILEHHERLDRSGYPKGAGDAQLSLAGRILALAEVAASVGERNPTGVVSTVLKLHMKHFDESAAKALFELLPVDGKEIVPDLGGLLERILARVRHVHSAMGSWRDLMSLRKVDERAMEEFVPISSRLQELQQNLIRVGIVSPGVEESLAQIAPDSDSLLELDVITGEIRHRLAEVVWEAYRHCSNKAQFKDTGSADIVREWCQNVSSVLASSLKDNTDISAS